MLVVRDATPDDFAAIDALRAEAFAALRSVYRPIATAATAVQEDPIPQLVATCDGTIVGAVRLRLIDDRLHLIALAVAPLHQRRGVARAIVEQAVASATDRGCRCLSLFTIVQTGNVAVFEKLGFRVLHTEPAQRLESVAGDVLTEAFMERRVRVSSSESR